MKTRYVVALSVVAGAALGAGAVHSLYAQTQPPVFQITMQEVSNPDALAKEFAPLARASVVKYGGQSVAAGTPTMMEGSVPDNRVVINQWPSMEKMRAWHDLPEYKQAREVGNKYAKFQIMAVPAVAPK